MIIVRIPIVFIILSTQLTYCLIKNNFFVCKPTLIGIDHNDYNHNHNQNNMYENIKNINMTSSHHNTSLPYIFPFPKIYKSNSEHKDNNKYKLSLYPKFYIHIIDNIKHDDDNESLDGGYETNLDQIEKILDRYCIESTYINYHYHHKYNNNNDIHSHYHYHEEAIQYYYIKNINIELTSPLSLIEINDVMTTLLSNGRNSRGSKNNNNDSHNHHHHSHDKSHNRHHDHNNNNNQNLLINELYTLDINNNNNHNVTITACGYRGIINAIMTLDQLLSASSPSSSSIVLLPSIVSLPLSIIDWPDNIWRGKLVR